MGFIKMTSRLLDLVKGADLYLMPRMKKISEDGIINLVGQYGRAIGSIDHRVIFELIDTAGRMKMDKLRETCENGIVANIDNYCQGIPKGKYILELAICAENHQCEKVKRKCMSYIVRNFSEVIEHNPDWNVKIGSKPDIMLKIIQGLAEDNACISAHMDKCEL